MTSSALKTVNVRKQQSWCSRKNETRYWLIPLLFLVCVVCIAILLPRELPGMGFRLRRSNLTGNGGQGIEVDFPAQRPTTVTVRPLSTPSFGPATQAPTSSPSGSLISTREYQVVSSHLGDPDLLLDNSKPQGKAFSAILRMKLSSSFQMLQTFALMTLFFATDGPNWAPVATPNIFSRSIERDTTTGWNESSQSVCSWDGILCSDESFEEEIVTSITLGKVICESLG